MNRLYGFSLNNTPERMYLSDLAHFAIAELHLEFWETKRNSNGDTFAPDGSPPARWLHEQDVDVWGYVDLQFGSREDYLGSWTPAHEEDPYWLRRELTRKAEDKDWWHYCQNGDLSDHYWGKLSPVDVTNADYRAWVVDWLLGEMDGWPVKQLRFDNAFFVDIEHYVWCPMRCTWREWAAGLFAIWDALRDAGVRIVANAAWQMENPHDAPEDWRYPAMAHLDGVMIERITGMSLADGWWSLNDERMARVIADWRAAGKSVVLVATLGDDDPDWEDDFDAFARHYAAYADEHDCYVVINQRHIGYGNTPWLNWYDDSEKPSPMFPDAPEPEDWQKLLQDEAWEHHAIDINPQASMYKAMIADGYHPASDEWDTTIEERMARAQYADSDTAVHEPRVYLVYLDDLNAVSWIEIEPKPDD